MCLGQTGDREKDMNTESMLLILLKRQEAMVSDSLHVTHEGRQRERSGAAEESSHRMWQQSSGAEVFSCTLTWRSIYLYSTVQVKKLYHFLVR